MYLCTPVAIVETTVARGALTAYFVRFVLKILPKLGAGEFEPRSGCSYSTRKILSPNVTRHRSSGRSFTRHTRSEANCGGRANIKMTENAFMTSERAINHQNARDRIYVVDVSRAALLEPHVFRPCPLQRRTAVEAVLLRLLCGRGRLQYT